MNQHTRLVHFLYMCLTIIRNIFIFQKYNKIVLELSTLN